MVLCLLLSNIIVIYCFTSNLLFYVCFMPICPYSLPIAETMLPELVIEHIAGGPVPHIPMAILHCEITRSSLSHEQNPRKNTMDSHDSNVG